MGFIQNVCKVFGSLVFEITGLSLIFVATIIQIILELRGERSRALKLKWSVVLIISLLNLAYALNEFSVSKLSVVLVLMAVGLVGEIASTLIVKSVVVKKEEKQLIEFIDSQMEREQAPTPLNPQQPINEKRERVDRLSPEIRTKNQTQQEIDFTHVKNIIERISCFNLNTTDKRTVCDLMACVSEAESSGITPPLKGKINDYLGALLKIMSRYNV